MAQIDITPASNPSLGLHVHVPNGTSAAAFTDPSTVAASVATAAPNSQNKQVVATIAPNVVTLKFSNPA